MNSTQFQEGYREQVPMTEIEKPKQNLFGHFELEFEIDL